ncbi:MAG: UMP kinase [Candidatus Marinimicrobia bacterium]|nr:UMP kinase [Candidatus Neomarinimicrobiota bacterium]
MPNSPYRRILLKMSGEILAGEKGFGIDAKILAELADTIKYLYSYNLEIGIVIGAGNIFRGLSGAARGIDRVSADYMGMIATVMNSVALQSALENSGCDTRVMSAITISQLAEPYIRRRAKRHLEKGRIVIFAGGTGNPYFTTDTAAALRAIEIEADIVIKGTKVDGVYDSDPMTNPGAKKFDSLTYKEVIEKDLRVMDMTAVTLCRENNLPIIVLDILNRDNFRLMMESKIVGTKIIKG